MNKSRVRNRKQFENVTNSLISSFRSFSNDQNCLNARNKYFVLVQWDFFLFILFPIPPSDMFVPDALIIIVIIFTFKNNLHSICEFMILYYHSWKKNPLAALTWCVYFFFVSPVHYNFAAVQTSKIICG